MTSIELSKLKVEIINYDIVDLQNKLVPVLHQPTLPRSLTALRVFANKLVNELHT